MKELHAVIRLDLEQKTEEDGSYTVPIAWVEIQTYATKWRPDKNKTFSILRQLMRDAKAPRTGYPKFGVVSADEKHVKEFLSQANRTGPNPEAAPLSERTRHTLNDPDQISGDRPVAESFSAPVYDPEGNWPEDFSEENGNYSCKCCHCGKYFQGHKRRVTCKVCSRQPTGESHGT